MSNNNIIYSKSRWNGWNGNECVYKKEYHKAIEYYNTAIELYSLEYRYFVNRSFCFDKLQKFESALEDAERALHLHPNWGKCYYRKARALKGLKRLEEAEICFIKVLQLEGNECKEAQNELRTLREAFPSGANTNITVASGDNNDNINEVKGDSKSKNEEKDMKFIKNSSKNLSSKSKIKETEILKNEDKNVDKNGCESKSKKFIIHDSNGKKNLLKELSDFLLNRNVLPQNENNKSLGNSNFGQKYDKIVQKCVVNENDSKNITQNQTKICTQPKTKSNRRNSRKGMDEIVEIWDDSRRNHWSPTCNRSQNMVSSKPFRKTEPTNPWNFKGLYISNIRPTEETKQILRHIMNDFGKVVLIDFNVVNETALINFDNPESPRFAMSCLQGIHIPKICVNNQKLRIRFRPINNSKNYPSISCATELRQLNQECYFWRTTGCNRSCCKLKHITANKGVDLQPWMQPIKPPRYNKRQHRNRLNNF